MSQSTNNLLSRTLKWERGTMTITVECSPSEGNPVDHKKAINYVTTKLVLHLGEWIGVMEDILAEGPVVQPATPVHKSVSEKMVWKNKIFLATLSVDIYLRLSDQGLQALTSKILEMTLPNNKSWPPPVLRDTDAATWLAELVGSTWTNSKKTVNVPNSYTS